MPPPRLERSQGDHQTQLPGHRPLPGELAGQCVDPGVRTVQVVPQQVGVGGLP